MSDPPHRPAGRPLFSLVESAAVGRTPDGRIEVEGMWGVVEPTDQDIPVPEVLRRMTLGPVALENVEELRDDHVLWRSGSSELTVWSRIELVFDELGGYVVPSLADHSGGPPLLSLVPTSPKASFRLPVIGGIPRFRVATGAARYAGDDGPVLYCTGVEYEAVLHRHEPHLVVATLLARPATPAEIAFATGVPEALVEDVLAYLLAARLVAGAPAGFT